MSEENKENLSQEDSKKTSVETPVLDCDAINLLGIACCVVIVLIAAVSC